MTVGTIRGATHVQRPSSLADVLDLILDKGIVIDAYVRVAVLGLELLTIDARIVIASVDTYLRFAEATDRLVLQPEGQVTGLPGLMSEVTEGVARHKTRGAVRGAKEEVKEAVEPVKRATRRAVGALRGDSDDDDGEVRGAERRQPAKRRAPTRSR